MSKKYIITVFSVVLYICTIDSLTMAPLIGWFIINAYLCYSCYKMFQGKSDEEIEHLTGADKFDKFFGEITNEE